MKEEELTLLDFLFKFTFITYLSYTLLYLNFTISDIKKNNRNIIIKFKKNFFNI